MNLFHQFAVRSPNKVFGAIVLGALAGVSYSLLIPVVLNGISSGSSNSGDQTRDLYTVGFFDVAHVKFAALFFGLCAVILFARTMSQLILVDVSIHVTTDLRLQLYRRVLRASVPVIERIGLTKLNAVFTEDVRRVIWGARLLPDLLVNLVTALGMLSFLYYLNEPSFWFVLKALIFGVITYQIPVQFANRSFRRSRAQNDLLHEGIRGLVQGIKDLKLDARKREAYFAEMLEAREHDLARTDRRAFVTTALGTNYGDLISFFVIGTVAFIFVNYHSLNTSDLIGVVMVLLYLAAPVAGMLAIAPQIAQGRVSLERIESMVSDLTEETHMQTCIPVAPWSALSFSGVYYHHESEKGEGFGIGPIDFTLRRGEVNFIVGGNGSGKSTLGKLISLHYLLQHGEIAFDGQKVDASTLEGLRQEIAAIYSDYYLFDRLLCALVPETLAKAEDYLRDLGLSEKVSIQDGKFSTLALSDGQKRRIALLVAFLEDKNLYVFDEWAADQDPRFKEVFYTKILQDLKARGKCVVVITHDDRYFSVADQTLVMENGRLQHVRRSGNGADSR